MSRTQRKHSHSHGNRKRESMSISTEIKPLTADGLYCIFIVFNYTLNTNEKYKKK